MPYPDRTTDRPIATTDRRVIAGIVGVLLALLALGTTLGLGLTAFLGVAVAWRLARRRSRPLTRGAAGKGAIAGAVGGFALLLGGIMLALPAGSFASLQRDAAAQASVQAKEPPPELPAWMRSTPEAARAAEAQQAQVAAMTGSPAFFGAVLGMSGFLFVAVFGGVIGVASWGATLLLAYAIRGRGLPRKVEVVTE